MGPSIRLSALALALVLPAASAEAADVGINAGVFESVGVPSGTHLALYPYVSTSLVFATESVNIIPALGIEWSPELSRWGFIAGLAFDFPIVDGVGFDLLTSLVHDQHDGDLAHADLFVSAGTGVSLSYGSWSISPSINLDYGITVPEWVFSVGFNFGYTL